MDDARDDTRRCQQILGFFVLRDGRMTSPQFSVFSGIAQPAGVTIAPLGDSDVGARLALFHRDPCSRRAKALGFTAEKNEKMEYCYSGELPFGKIVLVPVQGHPPPVSPRPDCPYEDYVTLLDGAMSYTRRADQALDSAFAMLDADANGYLSAPEMAVFKGFLGFDRPAATKDEWSDVLFGWEEGDLDQSLSEISCSFFKKFVLRLCQGHFTFAGEGAWQALQDTPYRLTHRERTIKHLERIFERLGFDKDLVPSRNARYTIRIYTERYSLPRIVIIPREKVVMEKAIGCVTTHLGQKWRNSSQKLTLSILECCDWVSVCVKNYSDVEREVVVDCTGSVGFVPLRPGPDGLVWKEAVPGRSKMLAVRLARRRLGGGDGFAVRCDVSYEAHSGTVNRITLR